MDSLPETNEKRGHCSLCGIEGQGKRDFLCDQCTDPEQLVAYCSGCDSYLWLTDANKAGNAFWEFLSKLPDFPQLDSIKGISVKLSWCPFCPQPRPEKMTILTYRSRE